MPDISLHDAINIALQHQQAGRLDVAESIYTQILQQLPTQPETLCYLGALCHQKGQTPRGIELLQKSLAAAPSNPVAWSNLSVLQQSLHQIDDARASLLRALELHPDFADAHYNLANILRLQNDLDAAIAHTRRAIELNPNDPRFHNNLGTHYAAKGQHALAADAYQRSLALNNRQHEPWNNLGLALRLLHRYPEAIDAFNNALALKPDAPDLLNNRGIALHELHRCHDAIADFQKALSLDPHFAEAANNLGNAYRAIAELDNALASYRRALQIRPDYPAAHSNLLYLLYYHEASTPQSIYAEHAAWAKTIETTENTQSTANKEKNSVPSVSSVVPFRPRLRIGYVGADFNDHCQSFFTLPLLKNHDRTRFELFIYSSTEVSDPITAQLRTHADHWHEVTHLTDTQLAQQIRNDHIDILIDLTMHMARSRLRTFAQKPAPLQLTWLAYPGTTGLKAIDYRLTDPHLDPPPIENRKSKIENPSSSESPLHLPHTFWCYDPLTSEPPVNPLPALTSGGGGITFASLNTFCKVTPPTLALWRSVLHALPTSRMLILAPEGPARTRVLHALDISPQRITFLDRRPRPDYLRLYHQIDLCLDTFPYNGHTTSLDAYWMGVPVITLVGGGGGTAVSRAGLSQLTNLNLPEFIAHTPEEFLHIATRTAGNLPRLAEIRATLRQRMQNSPLMDAPLFAKNLESLYETIWQQHIAHQP